MEKKTIALLSTIALTGFAITSVFAVSAKIGIKLLSTEATSSSIITKGLSFSLGENTIGADSYTITSSTSYLTDYTETDSKETAVPWRGINSDTISTPWQYGTTEEATLTNQEYITVVNLSDSLWLPQSAYKAVMEEGEYLSYNVLVGGFTLVQNNDNEWSILPDNHYSSSDGKTFMHSTAYGPHFDLYLTLTVDSVNAITFGNNEYDYTWSGNLGLSFLLSDNGVTLDVNPIFAIRAYNPYGTLLYEYSQSTTAQWQSGASLRLQANGSEYGINSNVTRVDMQIGNSSRGTPKATYGLTAQKQITENYGEWNYRQGYADGGNGGTASDTEIGIFDLFGNALAGFSSVFSLEIAPNITIGLLVAIPITVSLLLWLFKILRE